MREAAKTLLTPHYKLQENLPDTTEPKEENEVKIGNKSPPTYCVIFKSRLNQNFFKQDAIDIVGEIMKDLSPSAKVEYKNPDLAIIFEIMKGHCCLSVLPNYYKYKKYNLIELASTMSDSNQKIEMESKISEVESVRS